MTTPHSPISELATELLDQTLQYLEFEDLLSAIQVCQRWRQICLRSQSMRKRLFLMPQALDLGCRSTYFWRGWRELGKRIEKISLQQSYPDLYPWPAHKETSKPYPNHPTMTYYGPAVRALGRMNTKFFQDYRRWELEHGMTASAGTFLAPVKPIKHELSLVYRNMLLSQPPFQEVEYELYLVPTRNSKYRFRARQGDGAVLEWHTGTLKNASGVTVQDLLDVVAKLEVEGKSFVEWKSALLCGMHLLCPDAAEWRKLNGEDDASDWRFDPEQYIRRTTTN